MGLGYFMTFLMGLDFFMTPFMMLKTIRLKLKLLVRRFFLIGNMMDDLFVGGRDMRENSFVMTFFMGLGFGLSFVSHMKLMSHIKIISSVLLIVLSLMGSLPVVVFARLRNIIIIKPSHPVGDLVRMHINLIGLSSFEQGLLQIKVCLVFFASCDRYQAN